MSEESCSVGAMSAADIIPNLQIYVDKALVKHNIPAISQAVWKGCPLNSGNSMFRFFIPHGLGHHLGCTVHANGELENLTRNAFAEWDRSS